MRWLLFFLGQFLVAWANMSTGMSLVAYIVFQGLLFAGLITANIQYDFKVQREKDRNERIATGNELLREIRNNTLKPAKHPRSTEEFKQIFDSNPNDEPYELA